MLEDLKNVGPTFYRMMNAILKDQMYRNIFAYVNDIVIASKKKETQIDDLAETFANMRGAQLKLKSEKCVFGVQKGKVLGCPMSVKGIEANLEKKQCNSTHEISSVQNRGLEAHRKNRSIEPIHVKADRAKPTILQCSQGLWQFPIGVRTTGSFQCT
jgi:hypothetical protein